MTASTGRVTAGQGGIVTLVLFMIVNLSGWGVISTASDDSRPHGVTRGQVRAAPHIYKVERVRDLITVHFDTEAGRSYTVQAISSISGGTWSNLVTFPALPFPNHYVFAESLTNRPGSFYRLEVSP